MATAMVASAPSVVDRSWRAAAVAGRAEAEDPAAAGRWVVARAVQGPAVQGAAVQADLARNQ
jgi:hypothetical protein